MKEKLAALQLFSTLAEAGSFALAAERMGISRNKASKLIMDLEASLGTRLLNRTTRQLKLTDAGERYLERVDPILERLFVADAEAQQTVATAQGVLRINAPISFGVRHIAPRLSRFMESHPGVQLEFSLNDRRVDLLAEGYDLVIRIGPLTDSSLVARKLASSRLIACASPRYLREAEPLEQPSDLKAHPCLVYPMEHGASDWRFVRVSDGNPAHVKVTRRLWANNGDALDAIGRSAMGVILQPSFIVADALRSGDLVRVLPDYEGELLTINAIYPHRAYLPARTRAFLNFLIAEFETATPWSTWDTTETA